MARRPRRAGMYSSVRRMRSGPSKRTVITTGSGAERADSMTARTSSRFEDGRHLVGAGEERDAPRALQRLERGVAADFGIARGEQRIRDGLHEVGVGVQGVDGPVRQFGRLGREVGQIPWGVGHRSLRGRPGRGAPGGGSQFC